MQVQRLTEYRLQKAGEKQGLPTGDSNDWWIWAKGSRDYYTILNNTFPRQILNFHPLTETDSFDWCIQVLAPDENILDELKSYLHLLSRTLHLESSMDECFALDWHSKFGSGGKPALTMMGQWVNKAKSYSSEPDSSGDLNVAALIADQMAEFVKHHPLYKGCDGITAVLPSNPDKAFDLPSVIAESLEQEIGIPFLREALYKRRITAQMKYCLSSDDKEDNIKNSVGANRYVIKAKHLLLIDDIFDSGMTINETAKVLKVGGVTKIFGLTATKTLKRNFR